MWQISYHHQMVRSRVIISWQKCDFSMTKIWMNLTKNMGVCGFFFKLNLLPPNSLCSQGDVWDGEFHPCPNQPISSATKSEPSDKPPQLIKASFTTNKNYDIIISCILHLNIKVLDKTCPLMHLYQRCLTLVKSVVHLTEQIGL